MGEAAFNSLVALVVAFGISTAAIPPVKRIGLAVRALDYPGGRRDQAGAIPRLGGAAVVMGLLAGTATLALLRWDAFNSNVDLADKIVLPLALLLIFICGLVEDTIGISPLVRLLMQTTASLMVIKAGWAFGSVSLPFFGKLDLGVFGVLLSLIWIVGVTNAVNLLDGLDGLAGGVVAIIASSMLVFSIWRHDFHTILIMSAVVGACLGFLRKNWAPAQIYLGDAGSLTLGFVLAIVSIRSSIKAPAAIAILVPILALGLPVIDTLLVMLFRFTKRARGPMIKRAARMFRADRSHLHHLLVRLGLSRQRIVLVIYIVAAAFCSMALIVATSRDAYLGLVLVGLEILVVFGMRQLGLRADKESHGLHGLTRIQEQ